MKRLDSAEKKVLQELQRMFADPAATAKRYARYAKLCYAGVFASAVAGGVIAESETPSDAKLIAAVAIGICIGLSIYFGSAAKQVPYFTQFCSLDTEAVRKRLTEEIK